MFDLPILRLHRHSGLSAASIVLVEMATSIVCNGAKYTNHGLVGYGFIPSNARDKYGDTLGGFGSSVAIEQGSWKRNEDGTYSGIAWCLPDRGW